MLSFPSSVASGPVTEATQGGVMDCEHVALPPIASARTPPEEKPPSTVEHSSTADGPVLEGKEGPTAQLGPAGRQR